MATGRPERDALDRFRERSSQFLLARQRATTDTATDTGPGGLVYLEQGKAEAMRAAARSSLMCPEPACPSPEITTVSRSATGARDGFRHLVKPSGAHEPESALHKQGKALVARWARGLPGVVDVAEEVSVTGADGRVAQVADVLLTSARGNRMAVEIQYASISVEEWQAREKSYADLGASVTWLWGHCGAQSPILGRFRAIAKALLDRPAPVLWINPSEERVAWAWDLNGQMEPPVEPSWPTYFYGTLDDLEVRSTGLFPPGFLAARDQVLAEAAPRRAARLEAEEAAVAAARHRPTVTELVARMEAEAREKERRRQAATAASSRVVYTVPTVREQEVRDRRKRLEQRLREKPSDVPKEREPVPAKPPKPPRRACYRCGGRLDDALLAVGLHFGCE